MHTPAPRRLLRVLSLSLLISLSASVHAQPSGGPYGPQPKVYEVPADAGHVYYVAPDGQADRAGADLTAPTSLESALAKVVTGDAIILRGGTYRTGGLKLNQGVTMQPYRDEKPVLKGTQVANQWTALRDGIWRTSWKSLFPCAPRDWWQRDREGMRTPLHRFNNDLVLVDGRSLQSAGWEGELTADNYFIDYERGYVYLKGDPTGHLVEITAHDSALVITGKTVNGRAADHRGPALRGLTFTQYAYRALEVEGRRGSVPPSEEPTDDPVGVADPATFGKEVVGTLLEDCTLTHCSRVAGYFRGDGLVIRRCLVSDTSTEGIYVIGSSDCLLERNIIARNNVEKLTGYYPSAVKIFNQTRRVTFRDNLVVDNPDSNAVWYDVGNVDGVFVNNWIEGCQDGLFFEISKGITVAGNVFVNCNKGIRILNSRDAHVWQNTFLNATASFERNERSAKADHFGWHPATGPDVDERAGHVFAGNLLVADARFSRALFNAEQPAALKARLTVPALTVFADNVFVRPTDSAALALITWSPAVGETNQYAVASPGELEARLPQLAVRNQLLALAPGAILQSPELKRLKPSRALPARYSLPPEIARLLGWPSRAENSPGAYPTE